MGKRNEHAGGRLDLEIRQTAGMVFENPDNQLVATVVEEDIGIPALKIWGCQHPEGNSDARG